MTLYVEPEFCIHFHGLDNAQKLIAALVTDGLSFRYDAHKSDCHFIAVNQEKARTFSRLIKIHVVATDIIKQG